MCRNFDATVPAQCLEEDAEDVTEKERQNFCDWFVPSEDAFNPAKKEQADRARQSLDSLFGDDELVSDAPDAPLSDADKLFD
jgi:hypothetical protein